MKRNLDNLWNWFFITSHILLDYIFHQMFDAIKAHAAEGQYKAAKFIQILVLTTIVCKLRASPGMNWQMMRLTD